MTPLVLLIHGFNVWDGGRQTVGKLRPFFAELGAPYVMINYGHFGLLDSRFKNDKIAQIVLGATVNSERPIVAVGHSNGCCILYRALAQFRAVIDHLVFINPALERDTPFDTCRFDQLDVWHSPSDRPVKWAKWLPAADARPWGDMGAYGASAPDHRVSNLNKEEQFKIPSREHSDVFSEELIPYYGPLIARHSLRGFR